MYKDWTKKFEKAANVQIKPFKNLQKGELLLKTTLTYHEKIWLLGLKM